jgi:hypothetical protein
MYALNANAEGKDSTALVLILSGGYAPTPFASTMSLRPPPPPPPPPPWDSSRLENLVRRFVAPPPWRSDLPWSALRGQENWTGQEKSSPLSTPRSVDWFELRGSGQDISRQDRNEWLWSRRPPLFGTCRWLRRTRSCPDRFLGWHYVREA